MKVLIGSFNPVKLEACRLAFNRVFPDQHIEVSGVDVSSNVSDQPFGLEETRNGAKNRVQELLKQQEKSDYYVGIEGGITQVGGMIYAFAWMAVSNGNTLAEAATSHFPLPDKVTKLIKQGMELGEANDKVFGKHNSKQQGGAIGLLTDGQISRTELYVPALEMALIPFRQGNKSLYYR